METLNPDTDVTLKSLGTNMRSGYKIIRKNLLLLIIVSLLGGICGYLLGFLSKPVYTARIKYVVQEAEKSSSLSSYAGIASQLGINMPEGSSDLFKSENIIELIKSNLIIDKTLLTPMNINGKLMLLGDFYLQSNEISVVTPDHSKFQFANANNNKRFSDSVLNVIESTIIRKDLLEAKIDNNVTIRLASFSSRNEVFAKIFLETLIKNVGDYYIRTKTERASKNVISLQKRTDSVKRLLYSSLTKSAISSGLLLNMNTARQIGQLPLQKDKIDQQIQTSTYVELVNNLEMAKLTLLKETPLFQIIDIPRYPLDKSVLRKAVTALIGLVLGFLITFLFLINKGKRKTLPLN